MEKIHEINESVYDINMDNLCQNSIELIKYARNITAKQVNNVQIMTYYSLGRWIVEVQQQGKHSGAPAPQSNKQPATSFSGIRTPGPGADQRQGTDADDETAKRGPRSDLDG